MNRVSITRLNWQNGRLSFGANDYHASDLECVRPQLFCSASARASASRQAQQKGIASGSVYSFLMFRLASPSPQPSPSGRGSQVRSLFASPSCPTLRQRKQGRAGADNFSLSLGERARVKGNGDYFTPTEFNTGEAFA